MSLNDLFAAARNSEASREAEQAQQQWVRDGTVTEEYVRSQVRGSFSNRTSIEELVKMAMARPHEERETK